MALLFLSPHQPQNESSSNLELKFHQSLKDAVKSAKSGHRIGILPGQYAYESIPSIECDLLIEGVTGNSDDVVIESSAFVDVFIQCANNLTLQNLTLKCAARDLVISGDFESFRSLKKLKTRK